MRDRSFVLVAGPSGAGKTLFIERLLEADVAFATCVRSERDATLREDQESVPASHPELHRYRDLSRLREDKAAFLEVMGWRGKRTPITAVVADLSNPRDAGLKKAVARVKRAMTRRQW